MNAMNTELRDILLSPIRPGRVGTDGKGHSHVEAYEIRAHLIRLFEFNGWDSQVSQMELVYESENNGRWTVCYRAQCDLQVHWPDGGYSRWSEWATGEARNQPGRGDAHDLALKTAESQALKRCAMNLGDQFGLSLYRKGSKEALVRQTWRTATNSTPTAPPAVDEHVIASVPESEQTELAPDLHVESEAAALPEAVPAEDRVEHYRMELSKKIGRAEVAGLAAQVAREGLMNALTHDADGNVLTLAALVDSALKRVSRRGAA